MDRTHLADSRPVLTATTSLPRCAGGILLLAIAIAVPAVAHALIPQISTCAPSGWTAPVVPRNAGDVTDTSNVPIAATLSIDQPTFLNWASCGNSVASGGHTDALYLDGALVSIAGRAYQPTAPSHAFVSVNDGPVWVRGGRHTLTMHADLNGLYYSGPGSVGDDYVSLSYVWTPIPTAWGGVAGGPSPPSRASSAYGAPLNCEARALTRPAGIPWCISVAGTAAPGLILYDDYTGATSGLSHEIGSVTPDDDSLAFLVGGGEPTPTTVYAGVIRNAADAAADYTLASNDASARSGNGNFNWPSVILPAGAVAQVFRLSLTAGQSCPIAMTREGGVADLAFALFPPGPGGVRTLRDALAYSAPQPPATDNAVFVPPVSGDYPLVVYRTTTSDLASPQYYVLGTGSFATAVAPAGGATLGLALASAQPGNGPVRLAIDLPSAGRVSLAVFDTQGRRLRTLVTGSLPAGHHDRVWDLRDDHGSPAGAGVFWARLDHDGQTRIQRLIVLH